MGNICRKDCGVESKIPHSWYKLFLALNLTKSEISKLYEIYRSVDLDDDGSVDIVELLTMLDLERNKFTEKMMGVFDTDNSGRVDFREFVMALWNYCTISDSSLHVFAFDMYDQDGSGKLNPDEVIKMLRDMYGKKFGTNKNAVAIAEELEKMGEEKDIDISLFQNFTWNHKALLFPAYNIQSHMQRTVLGTGFWERASNRRIKISKGKYMAMHQLMQIHIRKAMYDKVISDSHILRQNSRAKLIIKSAGTTHERAQAEDAPAAWENYRPPGAQHPGQIHPDDNRDGGWRAEKETPPSSGVHKKKQNHKKMKAATHEIGAVKSLTASIATTASSTVSTAGGGTGGTVGSDGGVGAGGEAKEDTPPCGTTLVDAPTIPASRKKGRPSRPISPFRNFHQSGGVTLAAAGPVPGATTTVAANERDESPPKGYVQSQKGMNVKMAHKGNRRQSF